MRHNSFSPIGWLAMALFLTSCVVPSAGPATTPTPVAVSFSDLVADPNVFDGVYVCTEGVYVSAFETTSLGAGTVIRDGLTYLTEPTIWIEGAEFTARDDCFSPGGDIGPPVEFCKVRVCGRFEDCGSCGHGGGWPFQIIGAQPHS